MVLGHRVVHWATMLPVERGGETGFWGDVRNEKREGNWLDKYLNICVGDWIREAQVNELNETQVVGLVRETERGVVSFLNFGNFIWRINFK